MDAGVVLWGRMSPSITPKNLVAQATRSTIKGGGVGRFGAKR